MSEYKKQVKQLEEYVGREVWLLPTGNHSRFQDGPVEAGTISKVGRKNATVSLSLYRVESGLEIVQAVSGYAICELRDRDCSQRYVVFEDESAYKLSVKSKGLAAQITELVRSPTFHYEGLHLQDLESVLSILSKVVEDE